MTLPQIFQNLNSEKSQSLAEAWSHFLKENEFDYSEIEKIDFAKDVPVVYDKNKNKFSIDFVNDKTNYQKKKLSIKSELLSKALGGGKLGLNVLDLSAGLGVDSIFLAQLGYSVTALERNPLIYLCLQTALAEYKKSNHADERGELKKTNEKMNRPLSLQFYFSDATHFLDNNKTKVDVIYFDPMFPGKEKSALPRQEMVFFKKLVGADDDGVEVLQKALKTKGVKRVAVKRPLKAPPLIEKPNGNLKGKLVRFDLYGVNK
jgi:16S rRNA (guanine1516-N2)-methyltransferase